MAVEEKKGIQQEENNTEDTVNNGAEETKGGENQTTEDESGQGDTGNNGNVVKEQAKTFTQEQVNRMMAREKNQGRAAALKELGIDPKDTKAMAMVKALFDSQKTSEEKAAEQLAENNGKMAEAEHRAIVAEAKAEAMVLGVQPQYVDDVVDLVMAKMAKSEDSGDLKTILGDLKTKYPVWFKEQDIGKKANKERAGQKGTGSSIKGGKSTNGGSENKSMGARLAAQRKGLNKHSYWGKH